MRRRDFLVGTSVISVPEGLYAQTFNAKKSVEELAEALCRRDGMDWQATIQPDFILILRKG